MPGAGGGADVIIQVMSTAGWKDFDALQAPPTPFHGNFTATIAGSNCSRLLCEGQGGGQSQQEGLGRGKGMQPPLPLKG